MPKLSRRKAVIKIRVEIKQIHTHTHTEKINETKSCPFEKISQIGTFSQTHQEKKGSQIKLEMKEKL